MPKLIGFSHHVDTARFREAISQLRRTAALTDMGLRVGLVLLAGVGIGLAVIVSTYFVDNVKLLVGLIGGLAFVLLTMRWPEFGIMSLVALLSGLVSLTWLPILHLGPVSLNISDVILLLLLGLVFLRATTEPGFTLISSPLMLPLLLFIGAFLLSAVNAVIIQGVNFNTVLRTVRVLILWVIFVPTLQLVRDERTLRRLLAGMLIFSVFMIVAVILPNRFEPLFPIEERTAGTGAQMYSGFTRFYFAGDMILYAMIPVTVASLAMIEKGNPLWRIIFLGALFYWLFKTFFRQYWLTLFIILIILYALFFSSYERWRLLKRIIPAAIVGMLILIILIVALPNEVDRVVYVLQDRLGSLMRDPLRREGSLQWRMIETRYALQQINRHPLLGIGLGNRYRPPMESEATTMYGGWAYKYIENGYLYIALMMGLVGLIPFLWLCAIYLIRVFAYYQEIHDDGFRAIYLGYGTAFLGMIACNIATPTFVIGTRLIFFPVAMAICETILRLEREKNRIIEIAKRPHYHDSISCQRPRKR